MTKFLALVVGVVAWPAFADSGLTEQDPSTVYRNCVKTQASRIAMAPASATEIAQAALHRCLKEGALYELSVYSSRYLDEPPERNRTDQVVSGFNETLVRMVISDVIEARMQGQGK